MPNDYELTVGKLQNFISDDQICAILCSSNPSDANKLILNCLINRMSYKEHLHDFCNLLEAVCPSHEMKTAVKDLRHADSAGECNYVCDCFLFDHCYKK